MKHDGAGGHLMIRKELYMTGHFALGLRDIPGRVEVFLAIAKANSCPIVRRAEWSRSAGVIRACDTVTGLLNMGISAPSVVSHGDLSIHQHSGDRPVELLGLSPTPLGRTPDRVGHCWRMFGLGACCLCMSYLGMASEVTLVSKTFALSLINVVMHCRCVCLECLTVVQLLTSSAAIIESQENNGRCKHVDHLSDTCN